jgi:hypothetical protein
VTRTEACCAVLAFLNQFISRGAEPDVIALRDHLRDRRSQDLLAEWLPAENACGSEVYEAMRRLFWKEASEANSTHSTPDLWELYSWTRIREDGLSADPAQWSDWIAVLRNLRLAIPEARPSMSPPDPA